MQLKRTEKGNIEIVNGKKTVAVIIFLGLMLFAVRLIFSSAERIG